MFCTGIYNHVIIAHITVLIILSLIRKVYMQILVDGLSKSYGMKVLFDKISFIIANEDKIGLIGINGTGKSTLLKIIAGLETMDEGIISQNKNIRIEYLSQSPIFHDNLTVLNQVLKGDSEIFVVLRAYESALNALALSPDNSSLTKKLLHYSDEMTRLNAWELESQVKTILTKLSITNFNESVSSLSGGQRKRLALASSLISSCDLLILDEPTNHLDNNTIDWLESYLLDRNGALLMVTHDRYFLDRVVSKIIEIDHSKLYIYDGNYTTFLTKKLERIELSEKLEHKRNNFFQRELAWIRRGALARSTKQKARIKRFDTLSDTHFTRNDETVSISIGYTRLGKKTISFEHASKSYDDLTLFSDFSYALQKDERIGIIGPNGAGKTTLLKALIDPSLLSSGSIVSGPTINIGYFSQDATDMDLNKLAIDYIKDTAEFIKTKENISISASSMMERFLFDDAHQYTPIHTLSGGEQRRLYLLKILMLAPNVLIFDEPTNDLDIDTLKILEAYLDDFSGIVIAVSHDRYFLDRVCNKIFSFEEKGKIVVYTGNYSDYMSYRQAHLSKLEKPTHTNNTTKVGKINPKKLKLSYQEKKDYESLDSEIDILMTQLDQVEELLILHATDFTKLESLAAKKELLEMKLLEKIDYLERLEALVKIINNN